MPLRRHNRVLTAIRAADWWLYKIPPLAAVAYANAYVADGLALSSLAASGLALLGVCLVAAYGYVLNDICDLEDDRRSQRPNRMEALSPPARAAALLFPVTALAVLAWSAGDPLLTWLFAVNLSLPSLYSIPPVRLKTRGVAGALADACGVHAVPMAIVASAGVRGFGTPAVTVFAAIGLAFFVGLRGIVVHQIADRDADAQAGVTTFGAALAPQSARRLVLYGLLPAEVLCLALFLALTLGRAPVAALMLVAFACGEIYKLRRQWTLPFFEPPVTSREPYIPLLNNELYEVWLPLAFALQLAAVHAWAWLVAAAHVALFFPNIAARTRWLAVAVGPLPSPRLFRRRLVATRTTTPPVVISATTWTVNGVNVFSNNLARGLLATGSVAHVLLTEEDSNLVRYDEGRLARPEDVPFVPLPAASYDGWGSHWGRTVRYLEDLAPCIYMPNSDYRHSCIAPRLSDRVVIVGVVHSDDPLHYDHVRRLGPYWNAIVCVSQAVTEKTIAQSPALAGRIFTIPIGVPMPRQYAERPPTGARAPLRVVYHGILKQHQKRVLDFPGIIAAARARGIPVELTIAGAGPDEAALRAAAAPLVDQGAIHFEGLVSPDAVGPLLDRHDVYLLASDFEGMPNALIEAMGHGCVPVVSRMTSGIPELVRDGDNGLVAPIGDVQAFADALDALWRTPGRRDAMSRAAYATVSGGPFSAETMVDAYREVFARAWSDAAQGRFVRPRGPILAPPEKVEEVSIFPVALPHHVPGVGSFPTLDDAEDYDVAVNGRPQPSAGRRHTTSSVKDLSVWVSAPAWTDNGVNHWSEDLARGLRARHIDARVLLTEEDTHLVQIEEPRLTRAPDIPFHQLTVKGEDSWGARWGTLTHLLESSTPSIYVPNYDWRHAAIVPTLSQGVSVIGALHEDDQLYIDFAQRQAPYWDACAVYRRSVARTVQRDLPSLAPRTTLLPYGPHIPAVPVEKRAPAEPLQVLVLGLDDEHATALAAVIAAFHSAPVPARVIVRQPSDRLATLLCRDVEIVTRLARHEWLALCRASDVIVSSGAAHWQQRFALVEAMAHGCVPVLLEGDPIHAFFVRDGDTGLIAGGMSGLEVTARLTALRSDAPAWSRLIEAARRAAERDGPSLDDMIDDYVELIDRVRHAAVRGAYRRPRHGVMPPPPQVGAYQLLTVLMRHHSARGTFPTAADESRYVETIRATRRRPPAAEPSEVRA